MASNGSFNTSGYNGRYLQFYWSIKSQSIANNQTTISWSLTGKGTASSSYYKAGNFKVVIDGTTVYSSATRINLYNGTVVASGEYTMTHNAQGQRSFSASAEAGIYTFAVNCTGSGSWSLTDIPRQATITSAPNFNDEQNPTINYSNPAGNNVTSLQACISLTGAISDIAYRDISKIGTSYTFNLTTAERNVLRQATTTSKTRTVYFYIKTVIGGNTFYSNVGKTLTITNANPTIQSITYKDNNTTTSNITGNNQIIIQNNGVLLFNFSTVNALKYATLSNIKVTLNGVTKTLNLSGTSVASTSLNFGTINTSQNATASIVLTDSRGNTTTYSKNITIASWTLPTAIITCQRKSNFYSETDINVNADYSSLNNKNQITIKYQYKKTTDSSYSALQTLQDDVTTTFTIDNTYAWNVKVIITDLLGSTTYNIFVDKGTPIVFFDRKLFSMGVNCLPTNEYSIESSHLPIDDVIYVGSQVLYDSYQMTTATKQAVLGSYNYDLVQGVFNGINIPSAYTRAYRITAQIHTQNNNMGSVWLNNIQSSTVNTWSNNTMRKIASTRIFKESEIELEQTYNYTSKNGTNLYCQNTGSYQANFWNITVHAYLVKNTTNLTALSTYSTTNTVSQA